MPRKNNNSVNTGTGANGSGKITDNNSIFESDTEENDQLDQMLADLKRDDSESNEIDESKLTDEELTQQFEQEIEFEEEYQKIMQSGDSGNAQMGDPYGNDKIYNNGTPDPNQDPSVQFTENPYEAELRNNQQSFDEPMGASYFDDKIQNDNPEIMENNSMYNPYEDNQEPELSDGEYDNPFADEKNAASKNTAPVNETPGNETPGNETPGNETPADINKPISDGFPRSLEDIDGPVPDVPNPFADPVPETPTPETPAPETPTPGENPHPTATERADGFPMSVSDSDGPVPDVPNPFAGEPVDPYGNNGSDKYYGAWQENLYSKYGASIKMDNALNKRNELFAKYLQPDPRTGELPVLDSRDIGNLMAAEQIVMMNAEELLSRADVPNETLRRNLNSIRNNAVSNLTALQNVDQVKGKNLAQVMTEARTAKVNVSPESMQKFGKNMPQNMTMQLQDGRGNQIRGMFSAGDPMAFANQNAMSQMSRMFNCGSIMALSYPLTIQISGGGVSISGNFTRYVPGSMPGNAQMNDPYFMSNPGMFTNTPALRSVANLNALDYVCGTNGRGPDDMTYRFGADGNFNGVCGMGTNQAFLPNPPMGLDSVPMMGSNMANAMSMTSPAMVNYNMFNYGMTPEASQGVVSRMNQMMNTVMVPQNGSVNIQIVPNSGWQNINLNITVGMMPQNGPANAFDSLNYVSNAQMPYMQQHALEQKLAPGGPSGPSNNMPSAPSDNMVVGDMNVAGGDNYASLLADVHELNRALSAASMVSGSKEYGNVREYAKYIEQELKGMQGKMAGPIAEKDEFKRNHVKEMMGNLRDLSEAYLERRGAQTKEKPSNKALIRDSLIRSAHALGSSKSDQRNRSSEAIFSETQQRDLYNSGMNKERRNAFKNMDPKEVGKLIKRTTEVGNWLQKGHPNVYSAVHNEAQTLLTKYLNNVKDKSPAEVGLTKKDMEAVKSIGVTKKNPAKTKTAEKAKTITKPQQPQKKSPKRDGPSV